MLRRTTQWAAGLLLLATPVPAAAQLPPPGAAPLDAGFSPYLNLFRPGAPLYMNYFGLTRPQIDTAQSLQNLQQQQADLAGDLGRLGTTASLPGTGSRARFLNYGNYFGTGGRNIAYGGAMARPAAGSGRMPLAGSRPIGTGVVPGSGLVAPVGPVR